MPEHAASSRAGAVAFGHTMQVDMTHEVFVLAAYGALGG
jgi:hypothetical protein